MRFLELTALQSALLAFLTTAAIVTLYLLKHRRRRFVVSSTQLWKRVLDKHMENSLFEKLRRYLSILLAVVTALLVALAIARPEIEFLTGRSQQTVIVLDTSPTMQARMGGGKTRWENAVEAAQAIVDGGAGSAQFRIADTTGHFDSPFTSNKTELRRLLERMHPVVAPVRFPEVDKPAEGSDSKVYLITDGVSPLRATKETISISVFEAAPNVGITAFEIRSMLTAPLAYEGFLEVFNSGKESRDVEITVIGAGERRITKSAKIGAGKSYREALNLSTFEGGAIRASVRASGDAFSPDDVAYSYLPVKRRTKTLLVTNGNKFLESALKLDQLVELSMMAPKDFTGSDAGKEYDALVLDRFAPATPPVRPALVIGPQNVPWLQKSNGFIAKPRFESWREDHPVMKHVSLFDVNIESAAKLEAGSQMVLAASGSGSPLIVASEQPRWVHVAFSLEASDFPYHEGFPIFLDNAIAWFGRERLALRRNPGIVEVPMEKAEVRTIDGKTIPTQESLGGTIFEASDPGIYVAKSGDIRQYVAVNFSSRDFSDINSSNVKENGSTQTAGIPFFRRELWFYMLCGALLLIGAEWFTYHRRITL
jgi:hypothetical protein